MCSQYESNRRYIERNRDKVNRLKREYYEKNKEKQNKQRRERYKQIREAAYKWHYKIVTGYLPYEQGRKK